MPSVPDLPTPNFDRVARLYRWAEYLTLGPLLQHTRTTYLHRLTHTRQALLFGDGDGRFLARLLARNPDLQATAVDISPAMLGLLRARCERASATAHMRLTTLHASALDAPVPPGTDLLVTHFFLDCLRQEEVDSLISKAAVALQPGALWVVSDFAVPRVPLLRGLARGYIRALYLAFHLLTGLRVQTLPDPQTVLARNGFRLLARHSKLCGLLYSELWGFTSGLDPAQPADPAGSSTPGMTPHPDADKPSDRQHFPADAQPDPEPAAPSLPEPDPGVFHHDPAAKPAKQPE